MNIVMRIRKAQLLGMGIGDKLLWGCCLIKHPTKRQLDKIIARANSKAINLKD